MNRASRKFLKFLVGGLLLVGVLIGMFYVTSKAPSLDQSDIGPDEWVKGNLESDIVLLEYSDVQCPACAAREPLVEDIIDEFGNHVKFVYRHFPLRSIHQNAQFAAEAAEAAGLQGKFWEMKELLFANQQAWSQLDREAAKTAFGLYANQIGLNPVQFTQDLESGEMEALVNEDYAKGVSAGVNSTPTFFLNGEEIDFFDRDAIREQLKTAIENGK